MLEKVIAAALEPVAEELATLEKRIDAIRQPDIAPLETRVEAVEKALAAEPDEAALRESVQAALAKSFSGYRRLGKRERAALKS